MLQYMGTRQPPRPYPVPKDSQREKNTNELCTGCRTTLWTSKLLDDLVSSSRRDQALFQYTYFNSADSIRRAAIEGCSWCCCLADGIHGHVYLDSVYAAWAQGSQDDDCSTDGERDDDSDVPGNENSSQSDDVSLGADDPAGIWDLDTDRDTLAYPCRFKITLCFESDGSESLYAYLNVRVECFDLEPENWLSKAIGRGAVDIRYYLHDAESYTSSSPFAEKPELSALGSDLNFSRATAWLEESGRSNIMSIQNKESALARQTLPSRLIRVEPDLTIALVETATLQSNPIRYTALSYVWGKDQSLQLLNSNETSFMTRLEYDKLSKTIQDAVTVTRRLGYIYLWVDVLCIVQDSDEDKARELPKMSSIYKNSAVTIVAAIAKAATEGFLHVQQLQYYFIDPFTLPFYNEKGEWSRVLSLSYPSSYKRWKDPVNDRAWTLQELLLSPRVMLCSYCGVDFIDRTRVPITDTHKEEQTPQVPRLTWSSPKFSLNVTRDHVRKVWLVIRGEYTQRKLSHAEDKLVAIAALASELAGVYGKYLAGLWDQDLFIDLQWRRSDPGYDSSTVSDETSSWQTRRLPRPAQYRAPSWSWASIDGEVTDALEDEGDNIADTLNFRIVSCSVKPTIEGYDYGGIRSASLVVEGRLHSFIWRPSNDVLTDQCDGFLAMKLENEAYPEMQFGEAMTDALEPELVSGAYVECLAMCVVERIPDRPAVEGLMLLPVDQKSYRRVGFFRNVSQVVFDNVEPRQITIL